MTNKKDQNNKKNDSKVYIGVIAAIAISLGSAIFAAGSKGSDVEHNTTNIERVERAMNERFNRIDNYFIRIENKMDSLK